MYEQPHKHKHKMAMAFIERDRDYNVLRESTGKSSFRGLICELVRNALNILTTDPIMITEYNIVCRNNMGMSRLNIKAEMTPENKMVGTGMAYNAYGQLPLSMTNILELYSAAQLSNINAFDFTFTDRLCTFLYQYGDDPQITTNWRMHPDSYKTLDKPTRQELELTVM